MSAYTYTTLDDPLADWSVTFSNGNTISGRTTASGINNAGQIVGSYTADNGNGYGFLYSGGTYTTVDDPLASGFTVAQGINSTGQIVGYYGNNSGAHGFLYSGGIYTPLDHPLAVNGTRAWGINYFSKLWPGACTRWHDQRHDPAPRCRQSLRNPRHWK